MRARAGIALFAALALTAIVALLLAGAVASMTLAQRSSRLVEVDARLNESADYALSTVLADPDRFGLADLPLGVASRFDVPVPGAEGAGVSVSASATRLPGDLLWLESQAILDGRDGGARRFSLVARFPLAGSFPPAALVSRGDVHIGHDVVFLRDTSTDAECGKPATADVVVAPGAHVMGTTASGDSVRTVVGAAASDSSTYRLSSRQVAALDSARGVVHVRGDTTIVGGALDGILVADGSITITGPFRAAGMIVARGRVIAVSGLFVGTGTILSFAPASATPSIDLAGASITYSACTVDRAFRRAWLPRQVPKRGWAEIF